MTQDEARLEAHRRFCDGRPCWRGEAWVTPAGRLAVGFSDGEFRYAMGVGGTWEEAFDSSERRRRLEEANRKAREEEAA